MTTLFFPAISLRQEHIESLIRQIEYLVVLDKDIQNVLGQTENSPLDKAINDLLDSFLHCSGANEYCNNTQIDKIIDYIFEDPYEEKVNDILEITSAGFKEAMDDMDKDREL